LTADLNDAVANPAAFNSSQATAAALACSNSYGGPTPAVATHRVLLLRFLPYRIRRCILYVGPRGSVEAH
jgi:hypothetical protein